MTMIASALMSSRDPYPLEKYQNDDNFRGRSDCTMVKDVAAMRKWSVKQV